MTWCLSTASLLILLIPTILACQTPSETWQALTLPDTRPPATRSGTADPLVVRTVRLGLFDGRRQVLFSEEGSPIEALPGETLAMEFVAHQPFFRVEILGAAWGGDDARAHLRLLTDAGSLLAETSTGPFLDRSWLSLAIQSGTPGRYRLEMRRAGTDRAGWWSAKIGEAVPGSITGPPPFQIGVIPEYAGSEVTIPVQARAERLAFLGGRSSYDHGIGWWRDYEVQGDPGDRQFLGDIAGWIDVEYESGRTDRIPLAFGFTLWWTTHLSSGAWGGPFPEPFASQATLRGAADRALRLRPTNGGALTPDFFEFQPRPEPIRQIRLIDNPTLQGFPVIGAISLLTRDTGGQRQTLGRATPADRPIRPDDLTNDRWNGPVMVLRNLLYRSSLDLPDRPVLPSPVDPDLQIGGWWGELLTGIWRANLVDLRSKFPADVPFRTSSLGAPNYGGYQGVGAWRDAVGFFSGQVWARDLGRSAIELSRIGDVDRIERSLRFAGDRLYDLPNAYPRISRRGERLPPRWTTVLGEPLYLDADREGDGNWENDSQALLILAYSRAWLARSNDHDWLARHVGTVRDAANWFVEQIDRPDRWKSRNGLLYGEGEAANDGGYDVLSNTLAWRALEAAARMVELVGEPERAARYRAAAAQIRAAVNRDLLERDSVYGSGWRSVAWNWGYGHEALAPVLTAPDTGDFSLESLTDSERTLALATYRRQLSRCPKLTCVRAVGYGQAYLAQAALLLDDLDAAGELLDRLAIVSHDSRLGPFLIPEGIAVEPAGSFWYRTGDLGNAVHQAEVIKALSLVAGIESNGPRNLRLLPRIASSWRTISVTNWPTPDGPVSYLLDRDATRLQLQVVLPATASVRVGPLTSARGVLVNGEQVHSRSVSSGNSNWIWLENLPAGSYRIESVP